MSKEEISCHPSTRGSSLGNWEAFLNRALKTAKRMMEMRPVKTPEDEALIVRNCARLMRHALDWEMEATDPHLVRLSPWEVLAMSGAPPGPNLDSPYALARLDRAATYRLSGTVDGLMDINIQVRPGFPPQTYEVFGDLGFADLEIKSGRWEVIMSANPPPGRPAIKFPEGDGELHLFLRIYWADWTHATRPVVEIECLEPEPAHVAVLTEGMLARQLDAAARYLDVRAAFQHEWFESFFKSMGAPGSVPGGNGHVRYMGRRYELAGDEALIVEFEAPKARYWSVQLYDGLVYDCMDFLRNITIRNNLQADTDPDDIVRLVVTHTDPAVRNWLDAAENPNGSIFYRAIWSETNPLVTTRIVKLAALRAELHPSTAFFSTAQRKEELMMRRRKLAHHFFW